MVDLSCVNLHLIFCASPEGSFSFADFFPIRPKIFLSLEVLPWWGWFFQVEDDDEPPDEVRLWEDGFKDRCTCSGWWNINVSSCEGITSPSLMLVQMTSSSVIVLPPSTPLVSAGFSATTIKVAALGSGTFHTTTLPSHRTSSTSATSRTSLSWAQSLSSLLNSWCQCFLQAADRMYLNLGESSCSIPTDQSSTSTP